MLSSGGEDDLTPPSRRRIDDFDEIMTDLALLDARGGGAV